MTRVCFLLSKIEHKEDMMQHIRRVLLGLFIALNVLVVRCWLLSHRHMLATGDMSFRASDGFISVAASSADIRIGRLETFSRWLPEWGSSAAEALTLDSWTSSKVYNGRMPGVLHGVAFIPGLRGGRIEILPYRQLASCYFIGEPADRGVEFGSVYSLSFPLVFGTASFPCRCWRRHPFFADSGYCVPRLRASMDFADTGATTCATAHKPVPNAATRIPSQRQAQ